MKASLFVLFLAACTQAPPSTRDPNITVPPAGSKLYGVFVGKIPCTTCERVKMELILHRRLADGAPSAYVLDQIFVGQGDDRYTTRGEWTVSTGTPTDPSAVVYRLLGATPAEFTRYRAIGDNILLLLDDRLEPRIGNEVHSFTLSRAE